MTRRERGFLSGLQINKVTAVYYSNSLHGSFLLCIRTKIDAYLSRFTFIRCEGTGCTFSLHVNASNASGAAFIIVDFW